MDILLLVLLGLLLGAAVVVVVGGTRLLRIRRSYRDRLAEAGLVDSEQASLVGLASDRREGTQTRGVGSLGLTADALVFVQLVPARTNHVPREAITSATSSRRFMERTSNQDLLVVTWEIDGQSNAVAFVVRDVQAWIQRLT